MIAVVGGIGRPIGPFIGAFIYVLLRTFALDILVSVGLPGERFQLLIGLGFLVIVFWSPDGVLGLWERYRARAARGSTGAYARSAAATSAKTSHERRGCK